MVEITFEKRELTSIVHFCWMNFGSKWCTQPVPYAGTGAPILHPMSAQQLRLKIIKHHSSMENDTTTCRAIFAFENANDEMLFKLTWGGK